MGPFVLHGNKAKKAAQQRCHAISSQHNQTQHEPVADRRSRCEQERSVTTKYSYPPIAHDDGSATDIESCERCGGKVRIFASIEDPAVIARVLAQRRVSGWAIATARRPRFQSPEQELRYDYPS